MTGRFACRVVVGRAVPVFAAALATLGGAPAARAQPAARPDAAAADSAPAIGPRVGERVLLRSRWLDAAGQRIECDARLTAITGDTLVVQSRNAWHACPRQAYPADAVESVKVLRGNRGSRLGHAAVGLVAGGATGALIGYAVASGEGGSGGEDNGLIRAVLTVGGALSGGTVGLVVGALLPAGGRWIALPTAAPVRVAVLSRRF